MCDFLPVKDAVSLESGYMDFLLQVPDEVPYIRAFTKEQGLYVVLTPDHALLFRLYSAFSQTKELVVCLSETMSPSAIVRGCRIAEQTDSPDGILFVTPVMLCSPDFRRVMKMKTISTVIFADANRAVWQDADFTASYFHARAWLQTLLLRPRLVMLSRCYPTDEAPDLLTDTFSLCRVCRSLPELQSDDLFLRTSRVQNEEERSEQLLRAVKGTEGCVLVVCRDDAEAREVNSLLHASCHTALLCSSMPRQDLSSALLLAGNDRTDIVITDHKTMAGALGRMYDLLIFTVYPRAPEVIVRVSSVLKEKAPCLILYGPADVHKVGTDILTDCGGDPYAIPEPQIRAGLEDYRLQRLGMISAAVGGDRCIAKQILDDVGMMQTKRCGVCSACEPVGEMRDVTMDAVLILKSAARFPGIFTKDRFEDFVCGRISGGKLKEKYGSEPLYGCLSGQSEEYRAALFRLLFRKNYLTAVNSGGDFRIRPTALSRTVSPDGQRVFLDSSLCPDTGSCDSAILSAVPDDDLFEALRQLRRKLAVHDGIPTYEVFSNITLRALTLSKPLNEAALAMIPYMHPQSVRRYSGVILGCIREHLHHERH